MKNQKICPVIFPCPPEPVGPTGPTGSIGATGSIGQGRSFINFGGLSGQFSSSGATYDQASIIGSDSMTTSTAFLPSPFFDPITFLGITTAFAKMVPANGILDSIRYAITPGVPLSAPSTVELTVDIYYYNTVNNQYEQLLAGSSTILFTSASNTIISAGENVGIAVTTGQLLILRLRIDSFTGPVDQFATFSVAGTLVFTF